MTKLFKNKRILSCVLAFAVIAVSLFTGAVVSNINVNAATVGQVDSAEGVVDTLVFGDYLKDEFGSASKYYDDNLADNGETGTATDPIIIDSAEELVYLCKASNTDTKGKYYKVADGIAGFNLTGNEALDLDGTLADNIDIVKGSGKNHAGGSEGTGFQGYFDGNGATVYGAWTNHNAGNISPYAGLFSTTTGDVTIKNIHVKMAHFTATTAAGGIVGFHNSTDMATLTIENCSVTDSYLEVTKSAWGTGIGAILGRGNSAPAKKEADLDQDLNNDGDKTDTIYINDNYIIKNCYVNLDADNFVSIGGFNPASESGQKICRGGVIGVCGSNAAKVSDCVVIGITPYATTTSNSDNSIQHSGLETHFENVYTTDDVAVANVIIGGTSGIGARQFTGKIYPTADANLKGAAAAGLNLDWSVWMLDGEGYPELANAHKNVTLVDKEDGTHAATCACGFGGIAVAHTYADGECDCGALLNCGTRKTIYWDGTVAGGIATGTGTEADPYVIKTAAELAWLIKQKADVSDGKYFEVDSAIGAIVLQPEAYGEAIKNLSSAAAVKTYFETNATNMKSWPNMGWEASSFAGAFDGNGVKIYGLYQVSTNNAALFPTVDGGASFKNVALMNSYLTSTAGNYQVGGIFAVTSSTNYGGKRVGVIWLDSCVVANNYMNNTSNSHDRSGVLIGSAQDVVYADNCLVYGNDAKYDTASDSPKQMPVWSCANNGTIVSDSTVIPKGLEVVNDGAETPRYYNMIRNSIIFDAPAWDYGQGIGSRFNDPKCYENVITNVATSDYLCPGDKEFTVAEDGSQIKVVADLADVELPAAFIATQDMPELKSFHDAVFSGDATAAGALGHAASCSCGLADSNVVPHSFVSDVEPAVWSSTYCEVCDYVCEHEDNELVEYTESDCLNAAGYTFDCNTCGYHEEDLPDPDGHQFTFNEAEAGADCQTKGTIAYNYCSVCEKNYAADADVLEPFENALDSIESDVYGECVALTDSEGIVYASDDNNHWTTCAVCEEPITTEAHQGDAQSNGAEGHSVVCEVCSYASDNAAHSFVYDASKPIEWNSYYCEVCAYVCEHVSEEEGLVEYTGDCVTAEGYTYDCPLCGYHEEDFADIAGHNFTDVAAEAGADCVTPGTIAHKYCSVCEKNYAADADEVEPFENALTDLTSDVYGDCVPSTTPEIENVEPAGCVTPGSHDEVYYCTLCGEEYSRDEDVADVAVGHEFDEYEGYEGDCTYGGEIDHKYCAVCDNFFAADEEDVLSTDYLDYSDIMTDPVEGAHVWEEFEANVADCENDGNVAFKICSSCYLAQIGEDEVQVEFDWDEFYAAIEEIDPEEFNSEEEYNEAVYAVFEECMINALDEAGIIIPAAHELSEVKEVAASYDAAGTKAHYACANCDKLFADAEGKTEVTAESLVIEKLVKEENKDDNKEENKEDNKTETPEGDNSSTSPVTGESAAAVAAVAALMGAAFVIIRKARKA